MCYIVQYSTVRSIDIDIATDTYKHDIPILPPIYKYPKPEYATCTIVVS